MLPVAYRAVPTLPAAHGSVQARLFVEPCKATRAPSAAPDLEVPTWQGDDDDANSFSFSPTVVRPSSLGGSGSNRRTIPSRR